MKRRSTRVIPFRPSALVGAALLALAVACTSSDSTSPSTGATAQASLSGKWTYSASNLTGGGVTCSITNMTLALTQSGSTFSGTTTGGHLSCSGSAGSIISTDLSNDTVTNGTINGSAVQFDFGSGGGVHSVGTTTGSAMNGTATLPFTSNGSSTTLTGTFTATKQ